MSQPPISQFFRNGKPLRLSTRRSVLRAGIVAAAAGLVAATDGKALSIHVANYGARGDGVTNDRAAFGRALEAWARSGGDLVLEPGRKYWLGDADGNGDIFALDDLRGTLRGNGATIVLRSTLGSRPVLFRIRGFENLRVENLSFNDIGTDLQVNWQGAIVLMLDGSRNAAARGFGMTGVQTFGCVAMLWVGGSTVRVTDITVDRCVATGTFYGLVCEENGDFLTARFTTVDCRRSYFPYGVSDHKVDVTIRHSGGKSHPGAEACCLIKRYIRDTARIALKARFEGPALPFRFLVKLEQQNDPNTPPGLITDIDLDLRFAPTVTSPPELSVVGLSNFTPSGTELHGDSRNRTDKVRIHAIKPTGAAHLIEARYLPAGRRLLTLVGRTPSAADAIFAPGFSILTSRI